MVERGALSALRGGLGGGTQGCGCKGRTLTLGYEERAFGPFWGGVFGFCVLAFSGLVLRVWFCVFGFMCLALCVWLCVFGFVCLALCVWLCVFGFVCLALCVWLCVFGFVWLALRGWLCVSVGLGSFTGIRCAKFYG